MREGYVARGDVNAAIQLLERELETIEGERAKASIAGQIATLYRQKLQDDRRAEEAAKRAIKLDPTNLDALVILGDLAFEAKRYLEASKHYEVIAGRAESLEKPEATRLLVRYVDALAQSGSTEQALAPMDTLFRLAPDDPAALERVAQVTYEHGSPVRAAELYGNLINRFASALDSDRRYTRALPARRRPAQGRRAHDRHSHPSRKPQTSIPRAPRHFPRWRRPTRVSNAGTTPSA